MREKVVVIGSGFSGLSAAASLAKEGYLVKVVEKHAIPGGRARQYTADGFRFDMGPSWYWMPDVFESFFAHFNKKPEDYYQLTRLDPSYIIYFNEHEKIELPADLPGLYDLFESLEPGSAPKLRRFLDDAAIKYNAGINELVYKPSKSITEFIDIGLLRNMLKMHIFKSYHSYIRKYFKDPRILRLLEFPILFLGATAKKTPALYSLMNYGDMALGTWYPKDGMYAVVDGFYRLACEMGVEFAFNQEVRSFEFSSNKITRVITDDAVFEADHVIASADYHHVEQQLLPESYRQYSQRYWDKRTMSPSALLYFLGIDKKIPGIHHHTLIFNDQFEKHAYEIYEEPRWPEKPSVYLSCPSVTQADMAPEGMENLFVLIPVATGLQDSQQIKQQYFEYSMDVIKRTLNQDLRDHVVYRKDYAHTEFINDYHAFSGNAYGLANTLRQTAILKPAMHSKKLKNLLYAGQLTVPGPGVPPAIISGRVAASEILKKQKAVP